LEVVEDFMKFLFGYLFYQLIVTLLIYEFRKETSDWKHCIPGTIHCIDSKNGLPMLKQYLQRRRKRSHFPHQ
jgi:hypothetical protein